MSPAKKSAAKEEEVVEEEESSEPVEELSARDKDREAHNRRRLATMSNQGEAG